MIDDKRLAEIARLARLVGDTYPGEIEASEAMLELVAEVRRLTTERDEARKDLEVLRTWPKARRRRTL